MSRVGNWKVRMSLAESVEISENHRVTVLMPPPCGRQSFGSEYRLASRYSGAASSSTGGHSLTLRLPGGSSSYAEFFLAAPSGEVAGSPALRPRSADSLLPRTVLNTSVRRFAVIAAQ